MFKLITEEVQAAGERLEETSGEEGRMHQNHVDAKQRCSMPGIEAPLYQAAVELIKT